MLWTRLRRRAPDRPAFRNQHPLGPYILDFFCAAARLAVEIDGATYGEQAQMAHDEQRDAWLRSQGITTYRVPASSVFKDADQVADGIRLLADDLIARRAVAPSTTRSAAGGPPPPSLARQGRQK